MQQLDPGHDVWYREERNNSARLCQWLTPHYQFLTLWNTPEGHRVQNSGDNYRHPSHGTLSLSAKGMVCIPALGYSPFRGEA
jgi:hypothetical protein